MKVRESVHGVEITYPQDWNAQGCIMSGEPAIIIKKKDKLDGLDKAVKQNIATAKADKLFSTESIPKLKRTKVEYEHLTESNFSVWDLKDLLANGELFSKVSADEHILSCDEYVLYSDMSPAYMLNDFIKHGVYRKVERTIEWWEDAAEFLNNANDGIEAKGDNYGCLSITPHPGVSSFGLSQDQWCDFARILLEQEGE